jgi:hypothetical protein
VEAVSYSARSRSRFRGLRESIGEHAKTKVWGCSNQYGIQINLRRMEQFVFLDLCCHSWLEPVVAAEMPPGALWFEKIERAYVAAAQMRLL